MNDKVKNILEWVYCIVIAVVLALLFRYFIGTPTIVQQVSMNPTLVEGQRLWLNRWVRTTKQMPERGDIITFEAPSKEYATNPDTSNLIANYSNEPTNWFNKFVYYFLEIGKESYIKRVIGLPGDHIEIKDGKVYINDAELDEPYLQLDVTTNVELNQYHDLVVPENCVFVMGDNRDHSTDSRAFGCIPLDKIEGKVWIRFWPLNLFGTIN